MNAQQAMELNKGAVIVINHLGNGEELAYVSGWNPWKDAIEYHALTGGGSLANPSHIVSVVDDNVHTSEAWATAYEKYWGVPFKPVRRKA